MSSLTVRAAVEILVAAATPARRRLFLAVMAMMLIGAAAELATIGAVLPFLALVTDPARAEAYLGFAALARQVGGDRHALIAALAAILVVVAVAAGAMRLILTWLNLRFVLLYGFDVGKQIFARLLRQPYIYFVTQNSSAALASIDKLNAVIFGVLLPVMQGVAAAFISVFIVICLVIIDPFAAIAAGLILSATYLLVTVATRRRLARNSLALASGATGRIKVVQEGLGGIRDILVDNTQPVFETAFADFDFRYRKAQVINNMIALSPRYLVETVLIVLIAVFTVYFAREPGGVVAAVPILGALAIGAQRLLPLMHLAYGGWTAFAGSGQLLIDIAALLTTPVNPDPDTHAAQPLSFDHDIVLENVSFSYLAREEALSGVSLTIRKGERIGFVGRTGSGKSTLIDLLMGLLPASAGAIRIDGTLLDATNVTRWQSKVAHVPQAIYLSDNSIASNIAFGVRADAIDLARVRDAARRADIDAFIMTQPQGYDTAVGERGVRLSGGQRQRIGIARALYKGASVLVFDEATSALDEETEASIMTSIYQLGGDITLLMIAHRVSTLSGCDRIIRMEKGSIAKIQQPTPTGA